MDNFRVRVLPVLGTMPAMFGMAMAAYILCELAGQPVKYAAPFPLLGFTRCKRACCTCMRVVFLQSMR